LQKLETFGIKLGLENIALLLERLGHPEEKYPVAIVGGTNGKGSVSTMLSAILEHAGYRVGTYLSPHLVKPEERILVNGREIDEKEFCAGLSMIRRLIHDLRQQDGLSQHPTYFEVMTALALRYFQKRETDFAVLEVGLGGRFDATNAAPAILSVITNVSQDHQKYLGRKISQIAPEKGGIIKKDGILISGSKSTFINGILRDICIEKKSSFYAVKEQVQTYISREGDAFRLSLKTEGLELTGLRPAMAGYHQGDNAATAFLSAVALKRQGFDLPAKALRAGLEKARLGGRLEVVHREPRVIIDGAHNRRAAVKLARYIKHLRAGKKVLVFGVMKDKDAEGMAKVLFPLCDSVRLFPLSAGKERAMPPEAILNRCGHYNRRIERYPGIEDCFDDLLNHLGREDTVICAGSIFLAGEVRHFFKSCEAFQ